MSAGQSIRRELCPEPCDPSELEQVLLYKYRSSGGDRKDPLALLFPGEPDQHAVRLRFTDKFALKDIEAGPRLTDEDVSDLRGRIEREVLAPGPTRVGNWVLFAALPVSGRIRCGDNFQILPVPPHAPRPTFLMADYPFLLQFRFAGSSNAGVEYARRGRRGLELELILSGLVANHIRSNRTTLHGWAIPAAAGDPPRVQDSILCQLGYHYEGFRAIQDEFSVGDGVPLLKTVPANEYYVLSRPSREQELPATFAASIEAYSSLTPRLRRKFLNSCAWLQHSHTFFCSSQSASYMSLVLAVEALMPPPEEGKTCDACRRHAGKGPTQRFKEFMAAFAPSGEGYSAELDRIYKMRSKLAHGGGLLLSDREPYGSAGLEGFEEWRRRSRLHQLVQVAVVNWLFQASHSA